MRLFEHTTSRRVPLFFLGRDLEQVRIIGKYLEKIKAMGFVCH